MGSMHARVLRDPAFIITAKLAAYFAGRAKGGVPAIVITGGIRPQPWGWLLPAGGTEQPKWMWNLITNV
jgi:2,4-dienoyl-CoA reductase-like NADH-dependent reductase (Old Yellow Enzyme family)